MSNQKLCKTCSQQFFVTDEDRAFYAKLDVPEPTRCPHCRNRRRMAWRNDRTFYKRPCSKTGKPFVSMYDLDTPFPVYHPDKWWSEEWDPMEYGQDFDFDKPFFEQWRELMFKVPRLGIDIVNCTNSNYCNYCGDDKNCYLDIAGEANEDCYYNLFTKFSQNCADCTFVYNGELLYESINCHNSYNCKYSIYLEDCNGCIFCYDLKGCNDCLFCSNLRQKKYNIFNKQYTKEEYEQELAELDMEASIPKWKEMIAKAAHRDMYNSNTENCTGNNIKNSKDCHYVFNVVNCEDCKYLYDVLDAKDCQDLNYSLYKPEVAYELISTLSMKYSAFSMASHYCGNVFYCDQCNNANNLFGCIGLNRKKYCILNKQYSKEEYEELLPKIIDHMKKTGEWGEFFPAKLSPHGYNETVAHEYMPLTKESAEGFNWKDEKETKTDGSCTGCGKDFNLIDQELDLYKRIGVRAPDKCPDCRHSNRIALRNPRALWQRTCFKCSKDIWTSYSKDRPETIFCEKCYLGRLY